MHRRLVKPEISGQGAVWSPHFQCVTIRGIFEVFMWFGDLISLLFCTTVDRKWHASTCKAINNNICIIWPYHRFYSSAALHGALIITSKIAIQLNENLHSWLASYLCSLKWHKLYLQSKLVKGYRYACLLSPTILNLLCSSSLVIFILDWWKLIGLAQCKTSYPDIPM